MAEHVDMGAKCVDMPPCCSRRRSRLPCQKATATGWLAAKLDGLHWHGQDVNRHSSYAWFDEMWGGWYIKCFNIHSKDWIWCHNWISDSSTISWSEVCKYNMLLALTSFKHKTHSYPIWKCEGVSENIAPRCTLVLFTTHRYSIINDLCNLLKASTISKHL